MDWQGRGEGGGGRERERGREGGTLSATSGRSIVTMICSEPGFNPWCKAAHSGVWICDLVSVFVFGMQLLFQSKVMPGEGCVIAQTSL